jgi:hypothetical protein
MRFLRVHQRQGAGRQRMALTTALVTPNTLHYGANGEGVMAVPPESLPGKIRMKQLNAR